jgi:N-succinyldiaminopimelate aminotransferase
MPTFAKRVAGFGTTIFTAINQLAAQHDVVNLGQGKPDFDGPQSVLDAASHALQSGAANQYAPGFGIPQLRQNIAEHAKRFYDLDIDPDQGVLVTAGATEGVHSAVLGLIDEGDEVILLEPYFDIYAPSVELAGGKAVYVPMLPPEWRFNDADLRAAFNDNTRAVILNSPHNPTGRVFSRAELELIAELCQQHDAIVISDEVYEHMTYDQHRHIPIATLPGMFERTLAISSAAKTFSVTGWKVGWAYGAPDLVQGVWRIHQHTVFAVNHPGQYGIAHALTLGPEYYQEFNALYDGKRRILMEGLSAAGLTISEPQGAFYIMADFSSVFDGDDVAFTRHLIEHIGVACIPPSAFFSADHKHYGRSHVRFAYGKHDDALHEAAERLQKLRA